MAFPMQSSEPSAVPHESSSRKQAFSLRYMGFRCTEEGREYEVRVDGEGGPRVFLLLIPYPAFNDRQARFQDAPDVCFSKLQRELAADAGLRPGAPLVVSAADLSEYRERQTKRPAERKRGIARSNEK